MEISTTVTQIYSHPRLRFLLHLLFWIAMTAARYYLSGISFNVYNGFPQNRLLLLNLGSTIAMAAFYYGFTYLILPRSGHKHYLFFVCTTIIAIAGYVLADTWIENRLIFTCMECLQALKKNNPHYYDYLRLDLTNIALKRLISLGSILGLIFSLGIPFGIKMALRAFRNQLQAIQLSKDKLQLELNFLKSQLNPHFLFNSMNNIYGLVLSGDTQRSASLVARLSDLLRYMLYESDQENMAAVRELQLIRDYTELETLRLNDIKVNTDLQTDGSIDKLPPLLFVPLLENAFKFCPDEPGATIDIRLYISKGTLSFYCSNSISDHRPVSHTEREQNGIGTLNTRKRLMMYYPHQHSYSSSTNNNTYLTQITIDLS
ncbi:sensor histidine kinase [Pedobacter sp. JY14-1]|uniref:sensor histidine kinase n=1 Tax=Pedobacter sp. JY14-1 TaxID=3034151 RepID=UPI0023E337E1|nr:sensor histidine kinase [Pedobacter sp. JY14-1]